MVMSVGTAGKTRGIARHAEAANWSRVCLRTPQPILTGCGRQMPADYTFRGWLPKSRKNLPRQSLNAGRAVLLERTTRRDLKVPGSGLPNLRDGARVFSLGSYPNLKEPFMGTRKNSGKKSNVVKARERYIMALAVMIEEYTLIAHSLSYSRKEIWAFAQAVARLGESARNAKHLAEFIETLDDEMAQQGCLSTSGGRDSSSAS